MKTAEIYVLRNKDTKKWFYEDYRFTFQNTENWAVETDNILEVTQNYKRYYLEKDLAEGRCDYYSNAYKLPLEVVLLEEHKKYVEIY